LTVRFALSAVVGLSGLVLLACAIFGQPALYLRAARQQWSALVEPRSDGPSTLQNGSPAPTAPREVAADQAVETLTQQVAQLQQQVTQLRDQLANSQSAADEARHQLASGQAAVKEVRQQLASVRQQQAAVPQPGQADSVPAPQPFGYRQRQVATAPSDGGEVQTPTETRTERREVEEPPPGRTGRDGVGARTTAAAAGGSGSAA
jgi:hypothetical protein